ncbi:hypothetical protein K438DRAFT_1937768 [Mycena galopus ATCC 62051]|nr:hypothetical protein K438DRAFT_1937768 [Mycena galopus ATCC 62051]
MSKLDYPKLAEELTPASISGWLGRYEDTFETWQAEPRQDLGISRPHHARRKVKERFVPSNWRITALTAFYAVQQGTSPFSEFADKLQDARNALAGAGVSYTINGSILKNHLLFHSHPILRLRVSGQQSFPYDTMKVNTLIAIMSYTWASLLAEGIIRLPRTPAALPSASPALPMPSSLPTPTSSSSSPLIPLSLAEKEVLRAAGGCYRCRKTPQSPGWIKHRSDNCSGDAALGILPHAAPPVVATVGPAGFSSYYEDESLPVTAVMPVYDPDEDDFSFGTDDSDLSTRNT